MPVTKPSASRARGSPGVGGAASRRALARSAAAPMTATPTAICSTDLGSARSTSTPHTAPGTEATRIGPHLAPRHARAPALAEQHEPVERQPEHGDRHDRALGLEQREHRRAEDEREPEARRGLHDGRGQRHDREEDDHYPTTVSSR